MASTAILTLSSTPPRPIQTYNMSSSPPLPLTSELYKTRPQIWTGNQASPFPHNALASFNNAATRLDSTSNDPEDYEISRPIKLGEGEFITADGEHITYSKSNAKPKKSTKKKSGNGEVAKAPKKPRKSRAKKTDKLDAEIERAATVLKAHRAKKQKSPATKAVKTVRKPRAKKTDGDGVQTKLSKAQVTKIAKAEEASKSRETKVIDPATDLGLAIAVKRRGDWTPPPPNQSASMTPGSNDCALESATNGQGFKDLFGSFGYTASETKSVERTASTGGVTKKRKLIDLVQTNVSEAATVAKPSKPKATKKKARTITDLATSAFMEISEEQSAELSVPHAPLLQSTTDKDSEKDIVKVPPLNARSKTPNIKVARPKKGTAQAPILLSPESALKQVGNQEFVFGTSSQLAREESPTFLRDLHAALQASNKIEDDTFIDIDDVPSKTPYSKGKSLTSSTRALWSAGTRDEAGELMKVDIVDLIDSPVAAKAFQSKKADKSANPLPNHEDELPSMDYIISPSDGERDDALPKEIGPLEKAIREQLLSTSPKSLTQKIASTQNTRVPRKTEQKASQLPTKAAAPKIPNMPDFNAYTTVRLEKEISSYGFKPIKRREQMVSLLEKCWEGKNRVALGILGTNNHLLKSPTKPSSSDKDPPPSTQPISPKRARGRPRKDGTMSTTPSPIKSPAQLKLKAKVGRPKKNDTVEGLELGSDTPLSQVRRPKKDKKQLNAPVEEISDSDSPITPSPPRRRASQINSPPLPLKLSTVGEAEATEVESDPSQATLFSYISRAVTSDSPSNNPFQPNWHEKILLYDPIILEELTLWLNTGALEKVGWDGEVMPKDVKKWCESKSICCLWKENLKGGTRSRY